MANDANWKAIRNGDRTAFSEIYKSYYQFLFLSAFEKCSNKELAKDCIHEMFLEIWKKRQVLPDVEHVGFYLRTYLLRKVLKELPKEQVYSVAIADGSEGPAIEHSYEDLIIELQSRVEMKQKVERAIRQLSKRELEIVKMKFFENKSYDEIAALTNATPRTVYNHVYNALRSLRKTLRMMIF